MWSLSGAETKEVEFKMRKLSFCYLASEANSFEYYTFTNCYNFDYRVEHSVKLLISLFFKNSTRQALQLWE